MFKFSPRLQPTLAACFIGLASLATATTAAACTRLVFLGDDGQVMTARSMDWKSEIESNLWVMPRGMKRSGQAGKNSLEWTSKYGSLITSGYDISTTDGVNEAGLNANLLWLVESDYPTFTANSKPGAVRAGQLRHSARSSGCFGERAVHHRDGQRAGRKTPRHFALIHL